uniref:Uncharacterized protein n=1 Tax=Bos mutus grunniens TaxID=30521 RepID=A0A8B9YPH1_BOSMU
MSTSSLSFFAGPCTPARSPGTAGRSTGPEERSYSSMCFRTAKGQEGRFKSGFSGSVRRGRGRPCPGLLACVSSAQERGRCTAILTVTFLHMLR